MSFLNGPTTSEVLLHRMKVGMQTTVGATFLESMRMEVLQDFMGDMILKLRAEVLADKLPPEWVHESKIARVPLSWWDHWKQAHESSWWAGWFARWRGHRTREIELEVRVDLQRFWAYPQANIALPPRMGDPVRMYTMDTRVNWSEDK